MFFWNSLAFLMIQHIIVGNLIFAQIKTIMRYHLTSVRMAIIKKIYKQ